jgi:AraC-like DNA-binding protein
MFNPLQASIRMKKVIELLKDTNLTVSEVAYEIGFSDPGYFGKVFAKEYNMSPSEYRQVHFSREN